MNSQTKLVWFVSSLYCLPCLEGYCISSESMIPRAYIVIHYRSQRKLRSMRAPAQAGESTCTNNNKTLCGAGDSHMWGREGVGFSKQVLTNTEVLRAHLYSGFSSKKSTKNKLKNDFITFHWKYFSADWCNAFDAFLC